mgnify:FL=1
MQIRYLRAKLRASLLRRMAGVVAIVLGTAALPSSGIGAQTGGGYALNWHAFTSGGVVRSRNPCYGLSGTIAQATVTPGITLGSTYTLFSGFWSAAPIAGQDQIFFDGFEDCKQ